MKFSGTTRRVLAASAGALSLVGCGGGGGSSDSTDLVAGQKGAVGFQGQFNNVKTAPAASAAVTGIGEMVVGDGKTKVSITATGFDNTAGYAAYVDDSACSAADPGGNHFKFNPSGPDALPNVMRIDLVFEVNSKGVKKVAVDSEKTFDGAAGAGAKSVVIYLTRLPRYHQDQANPTKIACADLKPE
ncbi:MAG: hypothetical protein JO144_01820 [Actinobacteria bacterium]|nr:hypothetical protein [Actinomycetota bacterium]